MVKNSRFLFLMNIICLIMFTSIAAQNSDIMNIGIIVDGPWQKNVEYIEMIKSEILELTGNEFDVQFPENLQLQGDWEVREIRAAVSKLQSDPGVDLILTLGVISSHEIATKKILDKPVVAPFILDPRMQKIPLKKGTSGFKNLSYIHVPFTSENTIGDFKRVVDFKTMAYLINKKYLQIIPDLEKHILQLAGSQNIKTYLYPVEKNVDEVLAKFPPDVEAVYISPLVQLEDAEYNKLISELKNRKLPSFTLLGITDVERGFYTTNRPDIFPRIARRIALNVQRILIGDKPAKIPVYFDPGEEITINMETARAINIYPSIDVITEAELINVDVVDLGMSLELGQAVRAAVNANLDMMAKRKFVSTGSENIPVARSPLLPQIDLYGQGLMIDKDRAETSFGSQPEKMVTGTVSASQLLYSEPVWANLSIQNSIQLSREEEFRQMELDIMLAAATAFFDVLRLMNFESIQKENLKRTKSNLEMARVRESVGSAGPAEVFRWESQLAQNRNEVIKVLANRNIARLNLNRIMHHKMDQQYIMLEQNGYTDELNKKDNVFKKYLTDLRIFDILPNFLVQEGLANSPELSALQAAISAQERALTSANNSFWAPTLALRADYTSIFHRSGAGSERVSLIPNGIKADDNIWNVALNFSLPLFKGAERFAIRRQSTEQLDRLRLEYDSLSEKLEQLIRARVYTVGASFAAIEQTRQASEAANKSLKVVQDGYAQGTVSIIDLLDAQNTALVSEELASNAIYDFIIELMAAERSLGMYYLNLNEEELSALRNRLDSYLEEREQN